MWRQLGQAMVEYTIVTAAFVTGLLVLNNGACPDEYEDCIEYLLTVMHDKQDGYSASITAVQDYGKSYRPAPPSKWPDDDEDSSDDSDTSSGPGEIGEDGIRQTTEITNPLGTNSYGFLEGSNVVDANGNVVGTYNSETGIFVPVSGAPVGVVERRVVRDEAGNILQMQAVVDCGTGKVYGFGYRSEVSGKFVNSLNLQEANISGFCLAPSYEVETRTGALDGGRIVNGYYYPVSITANFVPTEPAGEVVYWPELGYCAVMANDWDSGLDPDLDDDERYAAQVEMLFDTDPSTSPFLGRQRNSHYVEQTFIHGQPAWPNDCVSVRTVAAP
jgi:hypothetical protein